MLPKEFPPWNTVYDHFRRFNQRGVRQQALDALNQQSRRRHGKWRYPSYAILDSQSVKTQYASDERGFDAGKKSRAVNAISSPREQRGKDILLPPTQGTPPDHDPPLSPHLEKTSYANIKLGAWKCPLFREASIGNAAAFFLRRVCACLS